MLDETVRHEFREHWRSVVLPTKSDSQRLEAAFFTEREQFRFWLRQAETF
jgi:hypothetical protein